MWRKHWMCVPCQGMIYMHAYIKRVGGLRLGHHPLVKNDYSHPIVVVSDCDHWHWTKMSSVGLKWNSDSLIDDILISKSYNYSWKEKLKKKRQLYISDSLINNLPTEKRVIHAANITIGQKSQLSIYLLVMLMIRDVDDLWY